jgi:signal transduction histidine kinase/HAMP domain-containing protein/ActR/RegA family two-component response regulator
MLKAIRKRLQVKLILVIALALLIPTALIGAYSINITTSELLRTADSRNLQFVKSRAAAVSQFLAEGERDVLFLSQSPAVRRYVGTLAGNGDTTTSSILISHLKLFLTDHPIYNAVRILDTSGKEVAGVDTFNGMPTEVQEANLRLEAAQSYYIEAIRLAGQAYISDVDLDQIAKKYVVPYVPVIRFSLTLYAEDGGIVGVIVLKALAAPILNGTMGNAPGEVSYIVDDDGNYLAHPDPSKLFGKIIKSGVTFQKDRPNDAPLMKQQGEGTLFSSPDREDALQAFTSIAIPDRDNSHWTFISEEKLSDILEQINNARFVIMALATSALLIALALAWAITRNIVQPVRQLAHLSSLISQGQWDIPLPTVKSGDEISELSLAFESMAKELKNLYSNLEDRVIARTSELETVAKVSAAAVAILDIDKLLDTVSQLTKTNFSLYHAQIFLIDETGQNLVLAASPGETGQQLLAQGRQIPHISEQSVVANVARTGHGIIVNDVSVEAAFLANPLLPATRSEMAVPLVIGKKLLGVLDLQSDQTNRFTETDLRVMSILGDQIAIAVQNANLYKKQIETAKQLVIAQQKAEQANKAKSLFLSNMSHELRTPLNIVIGYTTSMLERPSMYDNTPIPEIYANDIRLIKENGYHLIGLINDILDLSKIEEGKLELQLAPINLTEIFRGVMATTIGLIKDKAIQIKSDYPEQLPLVIADAKRVRQIILNLMSNAIKFTEAGTITLHAHVKEQAIHVAVSDTGIGIPEGALSVIFDRFRQADQQIGARYGGTGLGLDISKQLCEMLGGDLTVSSIVGQGSTFEFFLPLPTTQAIEAGLTLNDLPVTSMVFEVNQELEIAQTVMVAADDAVLIDLVRRVMESRDCLVVATVHATDVLDMAQGTLPDMIFLDADLSNGEGWQIVNLLKTNQETVGFPIILSVNEQQQAQANQVAAEAILIKPVTSERILAAIECIQAKVHDSQKLPRLGE